MPSSPDMCFGSANKLAMCASSRGRLTGSDKSAELEASKAGIIQCSRVSWPVRSMEHNLVMKEFRQLRKLAASRGSASILIIARSLFLYTSPSSYTMAEPTPELRRLCVAPWGVDPGEPAGGPPPPSP